MSNSLIIALDFSGMEEVRSFLRPFHDEQLFLKVGMELFFKEGPGIVSELKSQGHQIFLDLKLYDIPNTVGRAMKNLAGLGVDLVNVHAAGGKEMMESAMEGLVSGTKAGFRTPACIAVTQLTSTSEHQMQTEQLIEKSLFTSVMHYAKLTEESGLAGVVCSVHEAGRIRETLGTDFITVTPGIRLENSDADDQKRIATPQFAKANGSSMIVVGRPITNAINPVRAYQEVKLAWEGKVDETIHC